MVCGCHLPKVQPRTTCLPTALNLRCESSPAVPDVVGGALTGVRAAQAQEKEILETRGMILKVRKEPERTPSLKGQCVLCFFVLCNRHWFNSASGTNLGIACQSLPTT
jgi:hypothetical protein